MVNESVQDLYFNKSRCLPTRDAALSGECSGAKKDGLKLSPMLCHESELQAGYQQLMTEAPFIRAVECHSLHPKHNGSAGIFQ
jgi:hypothetical protein